MPIRSYTKAIKHAEPDADDRGGRSDNDADDYRGKDGKRTQSSVGYSKGHADAHCGICKHFERPNACQLVEGHIVPSYWCRLFAKAKMTSASALKGKAR